MPDFLRKLDAIFGKEGPIQPGGDFSARVLEWGMSYPEFRSKRVLETARRTRLVASDPPQHFGIQTAREPFPT